jgi:hypothetical protein
MPELAALRGPLAEGSGLSIVDAVRFDGHENDVILWSSTLSAACAAFLEYGVATIDNLLPASAFDQIEERGGMIFVTERGAMLIGLSGDEQFPGEELRRAAKDVAQTVACAARLETAIRDKIRKLVETAITGGADDVRRPALKEIYLAKLSAREGWDIAKRTETDNLVRRFRALCEERWQAKQRIDAALAEIAELEAMVRSSSEVRANTILNKLAVYGFPLSVFGNLLGGLLIVDQSGKFSAVSIAVPIAYIVLVGIGIGALSLVSRRESRLWHIDRAKPAVSESTGGKPTT